MNGDLQGIRLIGGVLPPALLGRIQANELSNLQSISGASYHLVGHEKPKDAAARAWSYLRGAWAAWRDVTAREQGLPGTGAAREKWLLVLLDELGYGRLPVTRQAEAIDGTEYPISHRWYHVPIHLLGPGVDLDKRNPGVPGAARAPQAMLQEYLNRSDDDLWGILSNGLRLRLLRDSTAFAGSAYVEFDLEAIFDGELYAEFQLMWLLCHVSRVEKRGGQDASPADCWLEEWRVEAAEAGTRALDRLRGGVEAAITTFGSGFLAHPSNDWLRTALHNGSLTSREYHKALLRLIYRMLFLFVAEERGALLDPAASHEARERYGEYFSTARLRRLSRLRSGGAHPDLWRGQRLILAALGDRGMPQLGVPALGGLFDPDRRAPVIDGASHRDLLLGAEITNKNLLHAIRHLAWILMPGQRAQPIDYRHLGAEELGGVYESLLELVPRVDLDTRQFSLAHLSGNERKTTGSYYTPPALVSALLDTSLDPVLDVAVTSGQSPAEREANLLAVTVCDPASGSGGFLVAAARRIARRLAQVRSDEDEPTPEAVQRALHDVVARCIYGVDMNDLAAELAKVSLWLEALEPGKPLGFLDARIRVGNSLFGTTPALITGGVPDAAFKEIEGDSKVFAAEVRKRNKNEATGQGLLSWADPSALAAASRRDRALLLAPSDDVDDIRARGEAWEAYLTSDARQALKRQADAWAAAFVWPLHDGTPLPPTTAVVRAMLDDDVAMHYPDTVQGVERLASEYRFFHWHLEFPEVFRATTGNELGPEGWAGGFTCMLGNPPWEQVEVDDLEFFDGQDEEIAGEKRAVQRKTLIAALEEADPVLYRRYKYVTRFSAHETKFYRMSGVFPRSSGGRVNRYRLFAELFSVLASPDGRVGIVVQTGIATDKSSALLVDDWCRTGRLESVCDFINRRRIFPDVKPPVRFCLLTLSPSETYRSVRLAVMLDEVTQVNDLSRWVEVPYALMRAMNPETGLLPMLATAVDVRLAEAAYLASEDLGEFGVRTKQGAINLSSGAEFLVRLVDTETEERSEMVPVLESKLTDFYDFAAATFDGVSHERMYNKKAVPRRTPVQSSSTQLPTTRYFVEPEVAEQRWPSRRRWVLAGKEMTDAKTSSRASVFCAIPFNCPSYSLQLVYDDSASTERLMYLLGVLNSLPFDYFARQKMSGSHLTAVILRQLPIPPANSESRSLIELVARLALGLSGACSPLAEDALQEGMLVEPPTHPHQARATIDAAVALLFGLDRESLEYMLDSFDILAKIESERHGSYITKSLVMEKYDSVLRWRDAGGQGAIPAHDQSDQALTAEG
jgi:hypothetical protein